MRGAKTCLFSKGEYSTPLDNLTFLSLYMQFSLTNAASKDQEMKCQKSGQTKYTFKLKVAVIKQFKSPMEESLLSSPEVKQFACALVEVLNLQH